MRSSDCVQVTALLLPYKVALKLCCPKHRCVGFPHGTACSSFFSGAEHCLLAVPFSSQALFSFSIQLVSVGLPLFVACIMHPAYCMGLSAGPRLCSWQLVSVTLRMAAADVGTAMQMLTSAFLQHGSAACHVHVYTLLLLHYYHAYTSPPLLQESYVGALPHCVLRTASCKHS